MQRIQNKFLHWSKTSFDFLRSFSKSTKACKLDTKSTQWYNYHAKARETIHLLCSHTQRYMDPSSLVLFFSPPPTSPPRSSLLIAFAARALQRSKKGGEDGWRLPRGLDRKILKRIWASSSSSTRPHIFRVLQKRKKKSPCVWKFSRKGCLYSGPRGLLVYGVPSFLLTRACVCLIW